MQRERDQISPVKGAGDTPRIVGILVATRLQNVDLAVAVMLCIEGKRNYVTV